MTRYIIGRVLLLSALVAGVYVGAQRLEARPLDMIVYITVAYALVDKVRATVAEACRLKEAEHTAAMRKKHGNQWDVEAAVNKAMSPVERLTSILDAQAERKVPKR